MKRLGEEVSKGLSSSELLALKQMPSGGEPERRKFPLDSLVLGSEIVRRAAMAPAPEAAVW